MKLYKPRLMLVISGIISVILAGIPIFIYGRSHSYAINISAAIPDFFLIFLTVALFFLSASLEISYLKEVKDNKSKLGKVDKLCLVFQAAASISLVILYLDKRPLSSSWAGTIVEVLNAAIMCGAIIIYYKTRNTLCLSLLLWCIALQSLSEVVIPDFQYVPSPGELMPVN